MKRSTEHPAVGMTVVDTYLRRMGRVSGAVFAEGASTPSWLVVSCGLLRTGAERVVPAREAFVRGHAVYISYDKKRVQRSPAVPPGQDISEVVDDLRSYYRQPAGQRTPVLAAAS